jgi:hypothetical protein
LEALPLGAAAFPHDEFGQFWVNAHSGQSRLKKKLDFIAVD